MIRFLKLDEEIRAGMIVIWRGQARRVSSVRDCSDGKVLSLQGCRVELVSEYKVKEIIENEIWRKLA